MSTYAYTCPICLRALPSEIDHWSWPFVYSKVLIHLDTGHSELSPARRTEIAEQVADAISAEVVRRRLLGYE